MPIFILMILTMTFTLIAQDGEELTISAGRGQASIVLKKPLTIKTLKSKGILSSDEKELDVDKLQSSYPDTYTIDASNVSGKVKVKGMTSQSPEKTTQSAEKTCRLPISEFSEDEDGFHLKYDFQGGDSSDYRGNYEVTDDDGFITAHLLLQECLNQSSKSPKEIVSQDEKQIILSDPKRITLLKKSLEKFISYNNEVLIPSLTAAGTSLEKTKADNILVSNQISDLSDGKLSIKEYKKIASFIEENIQNIDKNGDAKPLRSYTVGGASCMGTETWKYAQDQTFTSCQPPNNPIGQPFNSLNLLSGERKEPENNKNMSCAFYKTSLDFLDKKGIKSSNSNSATSKQ